MRQPFGKDRKGREVSLFTLENDNLIVKVSDHGATLVSLIDRKTGIDVVHGFDCVEDYEAQDLYIGAVIGRTANRIEKGVFHLNGKEYHIPVNNNGNANHGGLEGFDRKLFKAEEAENQVVFTYLSKDGEEGYPGNLKVTITYTLLENGVSIRSKGETDADTLFAMTSHSYFNLDGSEDAMHHLVKIHADHYALSDANGLALDQIVPVKGTPFDFTEWKEAGKEIEADNEQLKYGAGYDHFYPVEGSGMRTMAEAKGKQLHLTMMSDFPGFHFYTANWLDGRRGKYGQAYPRRSAICFEAEYMPNAINYEDAQKPLVTPEKPLVHEIRFLLSPRD